MDKSIVVPIGLFLSVVYSIKLLVDARLRYLFFKGGDPDTVEALLQGEERLRRQSALRWGLMLLALALALGLADALGWSASSMAAWALMLGALGAGQLASVFGARALDRHDRDAAARAWAPPRPDRD